MRLTAVERKYVVRKIIIAVVAVLMGVLTLGPASPASASSGGAVGTWSCGSSQNLWKDKTVHSIENYSITMHFKWCVAYRTFWSSSGLLYAAVVPNNSIAVINKTTGVISDSFPYLIEARNSNGQYATANPVSPPQAQLLKSGAQATWYVNPSSGSIQLESISSPLQAWNWTSSGEGNEYGNRFMAGIYTGYIPNIIIHVFDKDGLHYNLDNYLL